MDVKDEKNFEDERVEVTNSQSTNDTHAVDYISAINEIKQNSVSKADYDKLKNEHAQLLKAWVDGEKPPKEEVKASNEDLIKVLTDSNATNVDYVTAVLELRQNIIDCGGIDPFVPQGKKSKATSDDYEKAEKVAKIFKECIEYANGDNSLFTSELLRRTNS